MFWVTNFLNKGVLDLNEQKRAAKHVMSALDQKDFKPFTLQRILPTSSNAMNAAAAGRRRELLHA